MVGAFRWEPDPFDVGGAFGMAQGSEPEQRANRGQPGVAGPNAVAPFVLEMVEEGGDRLGVELFEIKAGGSGAGLFGNEGVQQFEGVAVGGHGVRAQPERLHRDFLNAKGTIDVDHDTVTVAVQG